MRNVIVTGGSRGIGLGIARALAADGYQVIAVARQENAELAAAQKEARDAGAGVIHFRPCDLGELEALGGFAKRVQSEFGAPYGLVNNAGIGTSGILATMPDSQVERLVRLNVLSPMLLTKYVVRGMMTGAGRRIVNISSIVATTGYPGLSVYSATKSSLLGFTRSLARELGSLGITVNAVAPGFVDTEMTQELNPGQKAQIARRSALRRMPGVTDIAGAVSFLMSDAAANITATTLTVDAGNTA
ncbi:MAG TPA: SDR family NAD(P)-dependent oxidoreductase [Rhodopila sp.]|uniref:SDR family NAD(P)-dependent oxidoreductase n=1 Tax=Rhodopila sp. TaxID=2480087 RepID=UPI002C526A25|nr:SDR family NAD(P)-dependent oxidoreductase [Rhodopila sp.]HVY14533.1 SDR family NAD(P)-dependent oxidoreductase [Rhodopila sp.]